MDPIQMNKHAGVGAAIVLSTLMICSVVFAETLPKLKAGAALPLTNNDYASVGHEFQRGFELALDELGDRIDLKIEDDQGQSKMTVSAVQKLINVDRIDILFLAEYMQVQPSGPIAERSKVPTVVFWESSPEIESTGAYTFGIGLWQPSAGQVPARYAFDELKGRKAAIIYDSTPWSDTVVKYFKREFLARGGAIVFESALLRGEVDFRSEIAKLKATDTDFVFAPISEHPATFFQQLKTAGYRKPVLSSDQISDELISAAQGGFEGVLFSNVDNTISPALSDLTKKYVRKFESKPKNIVTVALSYDALRYAWHEWDTRGSKTLYEALKSCDHFSGTLGRICVNGSRSSPREEVMFQVRNGKATLIADGQPPARD